MRKAAVLSFTNKGHALAERVGESLRSKGFESECCRVTHLKETVAEMFPRVDALIFVGAAGIAVRAVAPFAVSKTSDPAVLVVDEAGRFVIPILSGHIGGANALAETLAQLLHAAPVITTATDVNKVFAVDTFAAQNGYAVLNPESIKWLSSALLNGQPVGLYTDYDVAGELPKGVSRQSGGEFGFVIGLNPDIKPFKYTLMLMPKCFYAGVGARRGVTFEALFKFYKETLAEHRVPSSCVASFASVDLKRGEAGIVALAEHLRIPFVTYSADLLALYAPKFTQSAFVAETTGTSSVCEAAAYLASEQGEIICPKTARNGMTLAIAQKSWRVSFENCHDRD